VTYPLTTNYENLAAILKLWWPGKNFRSPEKYFHFSNTTIIVKNILCIQMVRKKYTRGQGQWEIFVFDWLKF
jgi:hypothetical protein